LVDALLGLPIINVLSVAKVGGATGGTITNGSTPAVLSTKVVSFVHETIKTMKEKIESMALFFIFVFVKIIIENYSV
jgi:hypothetical protein